MPTGDAVQIGFLLLVSSLAAVTVNANDKIGNIIDLCSPKYKEAAIWKPSQKTNDVSEKYPMEEPTCLPSKDRNVRLVVKLRFAKMDAAFSNTSMNESDANNSTSSKRVKRGKWGRRIGKFCGAVLGGAAGFFSSPIPLVGAVRASSGALSGYAAGGEFGNDVEDLFSRRRKRQNDHDLICEMINAAIAFSDKDGNNALSLDELHNMGNTGMLKSDDINKDLFKQKDLNNDNFLHPNEISGCPWLDSETQAKRVKRCDDCDCDGGYDDDDVVIYTQ